jgi:transposase
MRIHTIGIDLGKTKFHVVGLSERGEVVVRKQFSRVQLLRFTANRKVHVIGMEACGGSHFLGRLLQRQGHDVRLMPAQYVKPYVKTNKSDYIDAEAIAEAVGRPTMRFVPIKSDDQLDLQSLHRVRERWVSVARRSLTRSMACCSNAGSQYAQGTALYRSGVAWDSGRRGCETVGSPAHTAGATEVGAGPGWPNACRRPMR